MIYDRPTNCASHCLSVRLEEIRVSWELRPDKLGGPGDVRIGSSPRRYYQSQQTNQRNRVEEGTFTLCKEDHMLRKIDGFSYRGSPFQRK